MHAPVTSCQVAHWPETNLQVPFGCLIDLYEQTSHEPLAANLAQSGSGVIGVETIGTHFLSSLS